MNIILLPFFFRIGRQLQCPSFHLVQLYTRIKNKNPNSPDYLQVYDKLYWEQSHRNTIAPPTASSAEFNINAPCTFKLKIQCCLSRKIKFPTPFFCFKRQRQCQTLNIIRQIMNCTNITNTELEYASNVVNYQMSHLI